MVRGTSAPPRRTFDRVLRCWPLVVALTAACGTTVVRQVEAGDRALAGGDYRAAERAYDRALQLDPDEEGRGEWARAKIAYGRGRIAILRIKRERPWEQFEGAPVAILGKLHDLHLEVRRAGGDHELEAKLDVLSNDIARRFVAGLETAADHGSAVAAMAVPGYRYLDPAVIERARALVVAGREAAELAAVGVGERPLARRVYQAMATRLGGAALDDARALTLPYGRSVRRQTGGVDCGGILPSFDDAIAVTSRRAGVTITLDTCQDDVRSRTDTQAVTWTETVITGYRSETRSYQTCTETPTDYYQCNGSPPVCQYSGSLSKTSCTTTTETVQIPIYETISRTGTRSVTRHQGRQSLTGRWTVRRGERVWDGTFGTAADIDVSEGPAYEHFPAFRDGTVPAFTDRQSAAAGEAERAIDAALTLAFQPEIDQAERLATGVDAARDPAAADEAWAVAALLGGERPGTWARYGLTARDVRAVFAAVMPPAFDLEVSALPAAQQFDIPPLPRRTPEDLKILEQRMVGPLGKAASLRAYGGWQEVPAVTSPLTTDVLAGRGFFSFGGIVESQGLLSRRRRSQLGLGLVDGAAGFLGGGLVLSTPEGSIGGGSSLLRAGASYSLGVAARHAGTVGLLAGLRADAEWFLLGTASGWHARVGGFARLELLRLNVPWTFAVQGEALDLVGDPMVSGELFLARVKKDGWQRMSRFFSLRYERRAIDAGVTVTGTSEPMNPTMDVEDLMATSWTFSFGLGF